LDFTPLEIPHKSEIDGFLAKQRIESSELTFLSMYIWRKALNTRFSVISGCLVITTRDNLNPPSLRFPLGDGNKKEAIEASCDYFLSKDFRPRFYGLTKGMAQELEAMFPGKFEIGPTRDYFDYVYSVERMITLSGKDLHGKRNHVNRFKEIYDYEYLPITQGDTKEITSQYDIWLSERDEQPDRYLLAERESIEDVLNNLDKLGCRGAKLYANGRLCAFTIGERLNDNTAAIRIEKADTKVRGAYAAINQMFLENEWSGFEYVNREDDFGVPGLRRAKKSYHPVFMVEKYKAILRGGEKQ
jgi:hypothetical protein